MKSRLTKVYIGNKTILFNCAFTTIFCFFVTCSEPHLSLWKCYLLFLIILLVSTSQATTEAGLGTVHLVGGTVGTDILPEWPPLHEPTLSPHQESI